MGPADPVGGAGEQMLPLEWIDWFNHRRLFHELGRIPPAEYEENYYVQTESDHQVETQTIEPM
jgi:transposase InsO family protein